MMAAEKNPREELEELCLQLQQDDPSLINATTYLFRGEDFWRWLGQSLAGMGVSLDLIGDRNCHRHQTTLKITREIQIRRNYSEIVLNQILLDGITSSQTLQEIAWKLILNNDSEGFGDVLAAMPSLQTLRLSDDLFQTIPFTFYGQLASDVLIKSSSLTTLQIEDCTLGDTGFIPLARGLSNNVSLKTLLLEFCDLDHDSMTLFVECWRSDSPLQSLSLAGNEIDMEGAQILLRATADHPKLKILDLGYNDNIDFEGLRMIGEELSSLAHLECLDIRCCARFLRFEDPDCDETEEAELQEKEWRSARQALLDGIKRNIHIKQLRVNATNCELALALPAEFEHEINFYTCLNRMGRCLLSTENEMPTSVWSYILANCQRQSQFDASLTYFFLCEIQTLVQPTRQRRGGNETSRVCNPKKDTTSHFNLLLDSLHVLERVNHHNRQALGLVWFHCQELLAKIPRLFLLACGAGKN